MTISKEELEQLKAIYKKHYGRDIADDDALKLGHRLLDLFDVLLTPPPIDTKVSLIQNG